MEGIFEALAQFFFELLLEIFAEIIGGIIEEIPEILDVLAEKIDLPIRFSNSSEIIKLNLFD